MTPEHQHLEDAIEELAAAVLGPRRSELAGGDRDLTYGLIARVASLEKKLSNGGIKVKIPTAVWVALITTTGAVMVQLIRSF